jgi:hypothetical protein
MSDYAGDAVLITLEGTREGLAPIQSLFAKILATLFSVAQTSRNAVDISTPADKQSCILRNDPSLVNRKNLIS